MGQEVNMKLIAVGTSYVGLLQAVVCAEKVLFEK
jgi:UDP-glucose 6-dehydrogenase